MSTTLITFLGRTPKRENIYRRTCYTYSDGSRSECAFFGYSLRERLRPDHLVILGTAGSMWDHLLEQDVALGAVADDERLELIAAVERKHVQQSLLDELTPVLGTALACKVTLRIIPYGHSTEEQTGIVATLASVVDGRPLPYTAPTPCFQKALTQKGLRPDKNVGFKFNLCAQIHHIIQVHARHQGPRHSCFFMPDSAPPTRFTGAI